MVGRLRVYWHLDWTLYHQLLLPGLSQKPDSIIVHYTCVRVTNMQKNKSLVFIKFYFRENKLSTTCREHLFSSVLFDFPLCIRLLCNIENITKWCLAKTASGNAIQRTLFTLTGFILAVLILRAIAANNRHSSIWLSAGTCAACVVTRKLLHDIKSTSSAMQSSLPVSWNRL